MKLAFACPYYGPTYPQVGFSQRANLINATASGHEWVDDFSTNGLQHRDACERIMERVLENKAVEAIFWTEHDVVLRPDCVSVLAETMEKTPEADIVTGVVFRRCAPYSPIVGKLEPPSRTRYEWLRENSKVEWVKAMARRCTYEEFCERSIICLSRIDSSDPPFLVDSSSMGSLLIRKEALRKLEGVADLFMAEDKVSIDTIFFMHTRRVGLKTYCVPKCLNGHLADPQVVTINTWKEYVETLIRKAAEKASLDKTKPRMVVVR